MQRRETVKGNRVQKKGAVSRTGVRGCKRLWYKEGGSLGDWDASM